MVLTMKNKAENYKYKYTYFGRCFLLLKKAISTRNYNKFWGAG